MPIFSSRKFAFLGFMALGVALRFLPFLGACLKWYETFFHEISHGLVSTLTGGVARDLVIRANGSGEIMVGGGWSALTSFAGYAGAVVWGCMIYATASTYGQVAARRVAFVIAAVCTVVELRWVSFSDGLTLAIVAMIGGSMLLLTHPRAAKIARPALRLIGANVAVTALVTPTYVLHQGVGHNDAEALTNALLLPQWFWVGTWLAWGGLWMVMTWRSECQADRFAEHISAGSDKPPVRTGLR